MDTGAGPPCPRAIGWGSHARGDRAGATNSRDGRGAAGVPGRLQRERRRGWIDGAGRRRRRPGPGRARGRGRVGGRLARRAAGDLRDRRGTGRGLGGRRCRDRRARLAHPVTGQPGRPGLRARVTARVRHELHPHRRRHERRRRGDGSDQHLHHGLPGRCLHALHRPARRHGRRGRHADPGVLRRPGGRPGRRRESPPRHQLHSDRRRVELVQRLGGALPPVAPTGRRTPR